MNLAIDCERLCSEIETLSSFSDAAPPAVTRIAFGPTDLRARAWVKERCEEAGLEVRQDAIGNIFARWHGSDIAAQVVGTGSHIDAIPNAGKYDGVVGVLGGLEAIRALRRLRFRPKHSIELLVFTSEEPTRFGIGCLGSRLLSGSLSPKAAAKLTDSEGTAIDQVRLAAGFTGELGTVKLPTGYYKAFLELHIEQGPILERKQVPLGLVTNIAAPATLRVSVEGSGGHAGGVLMRDRRDALCAAAELILAVENTACSSGTIDTVATVGMCEVFPGAVNSIPSQARLTVDIRDTELRRRDRVIGEIEALCRAISEKRRISISTELLNADSPANCASEILDALGQACKKHGITFLPMVSRAYHDSLFMARIAPVGMLFIPSHKGYSHRPDEFTSPVDISRGTLVLAETLSALCA